ncbi:MAG: hypothetical protein EXX96DRAFT_534082 [Benjaminiella poitrasii]|nr:MAG: hypothetical protein EXX96DRAFT_534082 [Benjaminiella poitrasii]
MSKETNTYLPFFRRKISETQFLEDENILVLCLTLIVLHVTMLILNAKGNYRIFFFFLFTEVHHGQVSINFVHGLPALIFENANKRQPRAETQKRERYEDLGIFKATSSVREDIRACLVEIKLDPLEVGAKLNEKEKMAQIRKKSR